ncbi:DUF5329 domain-containing protein [Methylotenera sp. 1P/1]|uniref:DUF5329 domain-containing protein n=1 Tax=Methylotenera sp. 1P/1 TaxID=1131551 RepID=UPI00037F3019|nr:DUF5329 domain-containing protein [Methylotenera sp. 1P/1]
MNRLIFLLVLAVASSTAVAAPTSAPVRAEIDVLLTNLQASGCEFSRNGAWYSGAEAKVHLLRKLEYLEGKSTLRSTEQFIELAASSSSFTGQSYQVKCGNTPPVKSQQWLTRELASIRSLSSGGKP